MSTPINFNLSISYSDLLKIGQRETPIERDESHDFKYSESARDFSGHLRISVCSSKFLSRVSGTIARIRSCKATSFRSNRVSCLGLGCFLRASYFFGPPEAVSTHMATGQFVIS